MAKANQHFVPRVYLKRWSPNGNKNVFYFEKSNMSVGEPRNVASILYERHTYTITFDDFFVLDFMPEVNQDFLLQINNVLDRYGATIFIEDTEVNINNTNSLSKALHTVDDWEFRKKEDVNKLAPKKAIIENIKQIRSYRLETALDDYVEKKWNEILDSFISEIERGYFLRIDNEDITVTTATIEGIISILLLFMCRNPSFDCQGIFPSIENTLLNIFLESAESEKERQEIYAFVGEQKRGAWLSQVYKALFNNDISFFQQYFNGIKEHCQVTVMRCPENSGSFLTSDNPAFSFVCNVTKANYNAIYFPLTPQYLLLIGKGQPNALDKIYVKTVTNKGVRSFNKIILSKARDSIVSNRKYLGFIL